jgi:hypothetical protein
MVEELLKSYGLSSDKNRLFPLYELICIHKQCLNIFSGLTARDYCEFGTSALNQPSESIRRVAERIIITLYQSHPKLVRQNLPLEGDISKKNIQYRQIFQQFDKVDKEVKRINMR